MVLYGIFRWLSAPIYLVYYLLDKFIFPIFLYAFEAIARTPFLNATAHSEVLPGDGCAFITGADSGIGKEIALEPGARAEEGVQRGGELHLNREVTERSTGRSWKAQRGVHGKVNVYYVPQGPILRSSRSTG